MKEIHDFEICCVTPEVVALAISCLENYVLRAMDALHLGCALSVEVDLFVSSDRRQIEAAGMEGLKVMEV